MNYIKLVFMVTGSLGLFLFGMKVMSEGVQKSAGDRLQRALNFMTKNRFVGVLTGFVVTAIVQSSSAVTVMLVSFVNAGLLTISQTVGVIFGSNIGTTTTAWIVSLVGFKIDLAALAVPVVGVGFIMQAAKWKHKSVGEVLMGFGLLFLGLEFLTNSLPEVSPESLYFIARLSSHGMLSVVAGVFVGIVLTLLIHSSAATITLVITLAFNRVLNFEMGAAITLGANIGTTIDAIMASIGANPPARQTALIHVLFNVLGTVFVLVFFRPFVYIVDHIVPGPPDGEAIAAHLALFHTIFNIACTAVFLPFVKQLVWLVTKIIPDAPAGEAAAVYRLDLPQKIRQAPNLAVLRAEKEIRDMAGLVGAMFSRFTETLKNINAETVENLVKEETAKEAYADQMREELSRFLIECAGSLVSRRTEARIQQLLRVISNLEDMSDNCYSLSLMLERAVRKDLRFRNKELEALAPFTALVEGFLDFVQQKLGRRVEDARGAFALEMEERIEKQRKKLRKLSRKQLEKGGNVKAELAFVDLVRSIEKLGNYCADISEELGSLR